MSARVALITGVTGQDGAYLAELLLAKGYDVHGVKRRASSFNTGRIDHLYLDPHEHEHALLPALRRHDGRHQPDPPGPGDPARRDLQSRRPEPRAGQLRDRRIHRQRRRPRHAAAARGDPHPAAWARSVRFYQASTSELYGKVQETPQRETTPFYPRSPYAAAKLYAYWITVNYREAYGMHASNGILFNHESPLRGETFVTRKITRAVAAIELGLQERLYLGNLDAKRDWGHARDYVEGMWRMLQQDQPDDYVLATGESHSVREFVELAFAAIGRQIDWQGEGVDEDGVDQRSGHVLVGVDHALFPADRGRSAARRSDQGPGKARLAAPDQLHRAGARDGRGRPGDGRARGTQRPRLTGRTSEGRHEHPGRRRTRRSIRSPASGSGSRATAAWSAAP